MTGPVSLANVYLGPKGFIVNALDAVTDGPWVVSPHVHATPFNTPNEALGQAVIDALASGKTGLPPTTNWKAILQPLLDAAHLRTWAAFQKQFALLTVARRPDSILITPTRNGGPHGEDRGYHELMSQSVTLRPTSSPFDVGSEVRRALGQCTR